MRVRSLASGLVVPVLLVGLVVLLATLQYRWLGQVSEAERAQLQKSLSQRAREFADDFDGEVTRLYLAMQTPGSQSAGPAAAVPAALDGWKASARFPQIVRAVYLAEPDGKTYTLRAYDQAARGFAAAPAAWPETLVPLRDRLTGVHQGIARTSAPGAGQVIAVSAPPLVSEIPALVIPVAAPPVVDITNPQLAVGQARYEVSGTVRWVQAPRAYLLVTLDLDAIRASVLPALAARHFPENDTTPYHFAIRMMDGTTVYGRGQVDATQVDASAVCFRVRPEIVLGLAAPAVTLATRAAPGGASAGSGAAPAQGAEPRQFSVFIERLAMSGRAAGADGRVALRQTVVPSGGWQILLQHAAGSLEVAVAQARRRNLALSFGILSVLAAGVMLVVVNARRTKQLAARQMDFVATVTHELRTPLAVIRSAAQNLSAGVVAEPAQAKTYGELIDKEGVRLTDMVEQVLAYAGLEAGKAPRLTQRVDLSHLVNDALDACQPLCTEAGITVEFDADAAAGAPSVVGDEAGLRLVMQNLVGNAVKHGADGRWIGVAVTGATHHGRAEACVTVTDRGRGIDAGEQAHVFEPFYRGRRALDDQVRGNGLGLSLVKRIVEAHGGRVAVASSPGAGTAFTVCLPAAAEESRT